MVGIDVLYHDNNRGIMNNTSILVKLWLELAISASHCTLQDKKSDTTIVLELPSSTSDRYCTSNNIEQILLLNGTLSLMLGYNIS